MAEDKKEKRDIYQEMTDTIIALMEKGELAWQKPWNSKVGASILGSPLNAKSGNPYTKENLIYL